MRSVASMPMLVVLHPLVPNMLCVHTNKTSISRHGLEDTVSFRAESIVETDSAHLRSVVFIYSGCCQSYYVPASHLCSFPCIAPIYDFSQSVCTYYESTVTIRALLAEQQYCAIRQAHVMQTNYENLSTHFILFSLINQITASLYLRSCLILIGYQKV